MEGMTWRDGEPVHGRLIYMVYPNAKLVPDPDSTEVNVVFVGGMGVTPVKMFPLTDRDDCSGCGAHLVDLEHVAAFFDGSILCPKCGTRTMSKAVLEMVLGTLEAGMVEPSPVVQVKSSIILPGGGHAR
jgi:hypothetical protein